MYGIGAIFIFAGILTVGAWGGASIIGMMDLFNDPKLWWSDNKAILLGIALLIAVTLTLGAFGLLIGWVFLT